MFSKSKINEPGPKEAPEAAHPPAAATEVLAPRSRSGVSVLSSDLTVVGNLQTAGDVQIDGVVEGDIRAHLVTVGEGATIRGEIIAEDLVINGRVIGRVRGLKVRLTSTARVEGDIVHKTIAIEAGAHFEGSVQRRDDPINTDFPALRQQQPAAIAAPRPASSQPPLPNPNLPRI
jgi:cytoskeletal protein CcmA (bactofilin family)